MLEHLERQRFLVRALTEARPEGAMHFDGALDDLFGDVDRPIHTTERQQWECRVRLIRNPSQTGGTFSRG
jgi:hypothetical protein